MKVDTVTIVLETLAMIFRGMIAGGIAWTYYDGQHIVAGGLFIFFLFEHLHEIRQAVKS